MSEMAVPFLPLNRVNATYIDQYLKRLPEFFENEYLILGETLERFEDEYAQFCGVKYALGVANGLDALKLALIACGIGPGDEVIVPANTFIATHLAVSSTGATIVPVEPDVSTFCIDPDEVVARITKRTKAIIAVHLYGRLAEMSALKTLASSNNLWLIEDAAQSHGAEFSSKRAGAFGDIAAFSLYPGKNLGAIGDAGIITTDNPELANRVKTLRNYGSPAKYVHDEKRGTNSRLDPLQALFLSIKLKDLDRANAERRAIANQYSAKIRNGEILLPQIPDDRLSHVWHLYVVRISSRRAGFISHMKKHGVQTLIHYPISPQKQKAYEGEFEESFPISEMIHEEVVSLPIYPAMTPQEISSVIKAVNDW